MLDNKVLVVLMAFACAGATHAEGVWDSIKQGASSAATAVTNTAQSLVEKESPEQTRNKIDTMAAATLERLFTERPGAKALFDRSHGYAVFDTRKFSILITTGFGAGVAVEQPETARTYMKMATGGVNVGLGGKFYQVVFLFEDKSKFDAFVNEGFEAGTQASAVAGKESQDLAMRFNNGVAVFQLTEKGLMLAADLTGTRYWKNAALN